MIIIKLNKILLLLSLLLIYIFSIIINKYALKFYINEPKLLYYNQQQVNIFIQSNKCPYTLYFLSEYNENKYSKNVKQINLKDENYFITFYQNDNFYQDYVQLLNNNGLIKSNVKNKTSNLYLSDINPNISFEYGSKIHHLSKYQKVYRFYNAPYLFQKSILYKCYYYMKKIFYEDFNFMPETYIFPEQKDIIYEKFKNYRLNVSDLWMVKPSFEAKGNGISILDSIEKINLNEFVITKYIKDVNLIDGKKYDLRLYVLISGLKPLRIYLYNEGLIRISSEKYTLNISSFKNKYIHLTNTYINRFSKNFIRPNNSNDYNANIWNLFMYKKYLKNNDINWEEILINIKDIIIKSIICVYRNLTEYIESMNLSTQSFYNLLGFDILINNEYKPKLLEINLNPDMNIHHNLDKVIKTNLFVDTLNLIGIIPFSRIKNKPINENYKYSKEKDELLNDALCELERPKGGYELIFPKKENINKYKKYFIHNYEQNNKFWEIITS